MKDSENPALTNKLALDREAKKLSRSAQHGLREHKANFKEVDNYWHSTSNELSEEREYTKRLTEQIDFARRLLSSERDLLMSRVSAIDTLLAVLPYARDQK